MSRDRGAAAVEFALLVLPLTLLTFGIIYFGYAFHLQTMLDNAARDGARYFTLSEPTEAADAATTAIENSLASTTLNDEYTVALPPVCADTEVVTVTVTSTKVLPLTGLFGWDVQLKGTGSMRCTG